MVLLGWAFALLKVKHPRLLPGAEYGLYGGKGILNTIRVTPSGKKTKRVLYPNVQRKTYYSPILKVKLQIRVTTHTMRCIDKAGGFDHYVFHTPPKRHSKLGNYLRQKIVDTIREKGLQPPSKVGRPHKPPKGRGEMGKTSHTRTDSATVLQE